MCVMVRTEVDEVEGEFIDLIFEPLSSDCIYGEAGKTSCETSVHQLWGQLVSILRSFTSNKLWSYRHQWKDGAGDNGCQSRQSHDDDLLVIGVSK